MPGKNEGKLEGNMGIMEAIRKGFGAALKNFGLVLALFIFNAIWAVGSLPFINPANPAAPLTAAAMGLTIVFIFISIFIQGGTLGTVRDYLKAGSSKLVNFFSYGLKYYIRLLILGIVILVIVGIVAVIATVLISTTAPLNKLVITIAATTIAVAVGLIGLYLVVLLIMSPYALVCDELSVMEAMKRSMKFVKANLWKAILLLVLLILISLGIGFVVGFLTGLITLRMPPMAGQIVLGVVNSAFNAYLGVIMMSAFMSFYLGISKKAA